MKIAFFQTSLAWENPVSNRTLIEEYFMSEDTSFDLFVLPEMFTTGFTMNPEKVAEAMNGETILWLKKTAKSKNCAITGSIVIEENGKYFNRLIFIFPDGKVQYYDKRHLFTLAGEDKVYTSGKEKLIVEYKGFRICPLICYDLRFPVFARNIENYDLLLYVANWPKTRITAWDILLKARAIENMSYVIGVNRIGVDGNNHEYIGHSQAVDFLGNYILEPQQNEGIYSIEIDKKIQVETREKLAFLNDKDIFEIL